MIRYKLTNQDGRTHHGHAWTVGITQTIDTPGAELCSPDVFHFYDSPLMAVLMNPIHADIRDPRLWEVEIDAVAAHDGVKGGAKAMTLRRELPLPVVTPNQATRFAILCALDVYGEPKFVAWARAWLEGSDRNKTTASLVADAASVVYADAASASAYAAYAASASVADAVIATRDAARAAAYAARAADAPIDFVALATRAVQEDV